MSINRARGLSYPRNMPNSYSLTIVSADETWRSATFARCPETAVRFEHDGIDVATIGATASAQLREGRGLHFEFHLFADSARRATPVIAGRKHVEPIVAVVRAIGADEELPGTSDQRRCPLVGHGIAVGMKDLGIQIAEQRIGLRLPFSWPPKAP